MATGFDGFMRWKVRQKVRQKDRWCDVFNLKQQDLGRGTSGPNFLKNQKARFSETKAIMKDFIVVKERSSGKRSKRGETAALVAEEGFEPPTQGL